MIDQKQSNTISKVFGCAFIVLGFGVLMIGLPFLTVNNKNEIENTIMVLAILGGLLLIIGGIQTIKKSRQKDKDIIWYENKINAQLKSVVDQPIKNKEPIISGDEKEEVEKSEVQTSKEPAGEFVPDIIARWDYTKSEWKLMNKEETRRRLKEGIWVSLLIGLIGGWVLSYSRGVNYVFGFILCLSVGIFVSILKVILAGNLLSAGSKNTILITTNALIINGKFKVFQDDHFNLEYVKAVKDEEHDFLEFSLQWMTRGGLTNDQMRIYVPVKFKDEIQKVLDYFSSKGVKTC